MTCRGFLFGVLFVLVLAAQRAQAAELAPINFVSSGSGGIVEVIKFSQKQGFFKKVCRTALDRRSAAGNEVITAYGLKTRRQ